MPELNLITGYSADLDHNEPFTPPYVAAYGKASRELRFIAAAHQGANGPTEKTIAKTWQEFSPLRVILEGFESDKGQSPKSMAQYARSRCSNIESLLCDEGSYSIALALRDQVPFQGGEPNENEIKNALLKQGFLLNDLLGFYVVRQIPEWKREGTLRAEPLGPRVDRFIRYYLEIYKEPSNFGWDAFVKWYAMKSGTPFSLGQITTDTSAPVSGPGTNEINVISRAVAVVRERHLIEEIASQMNISKRVLVVYGQGHLVEARKVLQQMLGNPKDEKDF